VRTFTNLYEFFTELERCPLCHARMTPLVSFAFLYDCRVIQKQFMASSTNHSEPLLINLVDNSCNRTLRNPNKSKIYIGQQCHKYHFQCYIEAKINNKKQCLTNIKLNRIHFLKQIKDTYFAVSSHYDIGTTSTIITRSAQSREIILPVVDFDFSTKKLAGKLKTIELLG
jgi:hypothetical protein